MISNLKECYTREQTQRYTYTGKRFYVRVTKTIRHHVKTDKESL